MNKIYNITIKYAYTYNINSNYWEIIDNRLLSWETFKANNTSECLTEIVLNSVSFISSLAKELDPINKVN